MNTTPHNQAQELTAQELAQVSGGVFDPNAPIPVEGEVAITGGVNTPETPTNNYGNVGGLIEQKLQEYSDKYTNAYPYNTESK